MRCYSRAARGYGSRLGGRDDRYCCFLCCFRRFAAGLTPGVDMAGRYLPLIAHFSPQDKRALMTPAFLEGAGRRPGGPGTCRSGR